MGRTMDGTVVEFDGPADADGCVRPYHYGAWSAAQLAAYRRLGGAWLYWDPWAGRVIRSDTGAPVPHSETGSDGVGVVRPGAPGRVTREVWAGGLLVRLTRSRLPGTNGVRL
jgi:hypothetical protein